MTVHAPFQGIRGSLQTVTTATISASVTVRSKSKSVRLVNSDATNFCHVSIGPSPQTATVSDLVVLPGESIIVQKSAGDDTVAFLRDTADSVLHIQPGEGGI